MLSFNSHADFDIFSSIGLRENELLIIEITDLKVTHCSQCNNPITKYNYNVKVKDAFLKMMRRDTARGPQYTPYFDSYETKVKGLFTIDSIKPKIPEEGIYIGKLKEICSPWGLMANGDCRNYEIKHTIYGKVVDY
jgi:hypothetical protein